MDAWAAANLQLRADRDIMNEVKRREARQPAFVDCGCAVGTLCQHNNACPRLKAIAASRKAMQQAEAQRLHRAEAA